MTAGYIVGEKVGKAVRNEIVTDSVVDAVVYAIENANQRKTDMAVIGAETHVLLKVFSPEAC